MVYVDSGLLLLTGRQNSGGVSKIEEAPCVGQSLIPLAQL